MQVSLGQWFTGVPRRAPRMLLLALVGMVGCTAADPLIGNADDPHVDLVWMALQRGDLEAAYRGVEAMEDQGLAWRAELDLLSAREGRGSALRAALADGRAWLAARYDASVLRADRRLAEVLGREPEHSLALIERARRAPETGVARARAADAERQGGHALEAALITFEALLAAGDLVEAGALLERIEALGDGLAVPAMPSARVRLQRRRWDAATGRLHAAGEGVVADLEAGVAVPASLALLESVLTSVPMPALASRARTALRRPTRGAGMERARLRLLARLEAAAGNPTRALEHFDELGVLLPAEEALARRWAVQLERGGARTPDERIDLAPDRTSSAELFGRRVTHAWNLAARETYVEAVEDGVHLDLDAFTARLDEAAAVIPGRPALAGLPRNDFGFFGQMLETLPLREHLPGALVVCGKGLGLPADIACFDVESARRVDLPEPVGSYDQVFVRRPQVLGFVASQGGRIAGAGLDRTVYLDLDQVENGTRVREILGTRVLLPADDAPLDDALSEGARDLLEPLDCARRLREAAWADASESGRADSPEVLARVLDALALHEEQHIVDFQVFMSRGAGGKLLSVLSAGLSPKSVRAEIERRAQLNALRTCLDPRLPLAQCVDVLPVEGPAGPSEHAAGTARLLAQRLALLQEGGWEGAVPLTELGLDPERPLVQQLHRLEPETVRALALAIPD